jgi:hypothetical protein
MTFKNIATLIAISMITSGCALWPYKKDFDCPIKEGLKCKSLYEISVMADEGKFGPHAKKSEDQNFKKSRKFKNKRKGICHAC